MEGKLVLPGESICPISEFNLGEGTYAREDFICSALVGYVQIVNATSVGQASTITVMRGSEQTCVPKSGDIVTVKVMKINARLASVDILCVGQRVLEESFAGIIRQQDVRATEVDKVEILSSFRPGDIVRAEVVSLGDSRSYYLSTAKNELGVVSAKSVAGAQLVPVSWQEMQCPATLTKEYRKVAKTA